MNVKELKELIADLDDNVEVWIVPMGTPPVKVYDIGVDHIYDGEYKTSLAIYLQGDVF